MNEQKPEEAGRRIANEYLSKRAWAREWRRAVDRQIYPAFQREELEAKERQCDAMEEEAEDIFSSQVEALRKENSVSAREALRAVVEGLEKRTDLGFVGQRIVSRLKNELGLL